MAMSPAPASGLGRSDLPATCRAAGAASAAGQNRTKLLVRVELVALILAGVCGLTSIPIPPANIDPLAALAGVLFLVSLGSLVFRTLSHPEQNWYTGRAGAESVRTQAWRYAVGGDPYPCTSPNGTVDEAFLTRLSQILRELSDLVLPSTPPGEYEITPRMRQLRAAPFGQRRMVYQRDRIENQIAWYSAKADGHDRAARRWVTAAAAASAAGVVVAGLRMFGIVQIDLLGVAAACATAAIAWNQLNQNRNLVTAYRITARELTIIRDRIPSVAESTWAEFVSDAEDAMSREHTLWFARHGHPRPTH
jgi:hypothetical protein